MGNVTWNKPRTLVRSPKQSIRVGRIVGVCLVLLVTGGIIFGVTYFVPQDTDSTSPVKMKIGHTTIKEVKPKEVSTRLSLSVIKQDTLVLTNRIYKLPDGRPSVPLAKMTREERLAWLHDAKVERSLRHGWTNSLGEAIIPRTLFKSATEQAISRIFNTKLGDPPPQIPNIASVDGKQLAHILEQMSQPDPKDGERAQNIRANLNAAKEELKKYVDNGGDVNSFLLHYQGELATAYAMHEEAQKSFKEILSTTDDPGVMKENYERINKNLEDKGIRPLRVGPKVLEIMGCKVTNKGNRQ